MGQEGVAAGSVAGTTVVTDRHSKKSSLQNPSNHQAVVVAAKIQEKAFSKQTSNSAAANNITSKKQQNVGNTSPQQGSGNFMALEKENLTIQPTSEKRSPYFQAKADEEIKLPGTETLPQGKFDTARMTRTSESDEEATLVNPVKNLVFEYKEMNTKSEERNMTVSSQRDTVSSNGQMTKTVLKPIVNSKSIDQSCDGNTLIHNRLDTDRHLKTSLTGSRGFEYANENKNLVSKVSKEINSEINKIKRTLSSASKSPGRNIGESTPDRTKETPSSARKLMEFSGAKNTRINIELDKVDFPYINNRTGSLIPIQEK